MFRKKRSKEDTALIQEVTDMRHVVYDFRRRINALFENYRAMAFMQTEACSLEQLESRTVEQLKKLQDAGAVDEGNADCLVESLLGSIRSGLCALDEQAVEHRDFYIRQQDNMAVNVADIRKMLALCQTRMAAIQEDHRETKLLWDRYRNGRGRKDEHYEEQE